MGFLTPFGCLDNLHSGSYHLSVRDDVVVFEPITQCYKEAMKWLASMYKEDLINKNIFTYADDNTQYDAKGQGDVMQFGVFSGWWGTEYGPYTIGG